MSKVVLVTGCSKGGIGYALCEEFAEQGCTVYATARTLEAMDGFSHLGIQRLELDVTKTEGIRSVIQTIVQGEGRIDILVNNAGALCAGALLDVPLTEMRSAFEVNTFGALYMAQAVIPHMAARKQGTVVNIGSVVGHIPTPWNGVYAAAKAALHSLTEVLWMECKPLKVNIMLVAPGSVRSNIANNQQRRFNMPETSLYKAFLENIMERISTSQDLGTIPAEEFAKKVVTVAMLPNPPRYLTLGGTSFLFRILQWLPRFWVLTIMWRRFSRRKA